MRCKACNVVLTDTESVRKKSDGSYEDLCNGCVTIAMNYDIEEMEVIVGSSIFNKPLES